MKIYRKSQSPQTAGTWVTQLVGCAQVYHLRWYLRRPERSEDSYTFSSADSVASQRECHWHSFTTVPSFNETIGNMRYEVVLYFAENSQQTVQDRLKRVILHEANSES